MSSKRRQRRKACDGKVRHACREHACAALRKSVKLGYKGVEIYRCKFCRGWHLGHPRGYGRREYERTGVRHE